KPPPRRVLRLLYEISRMNAELGANASDFPNSSEVALNGNLSSVSSALDLKVSVLEATVCGMSSSLIQITVVPAFTVTRCGAKVKLSIFTSRSQPVRCRRNQDRRGRDGGAPIWPLPSAATAAQPL